jgi:uncharacterized protein YraI
LTASAGAQFFEIKEYLTMQYSLKRLTVIGAACLLLLLSFTSALAQTGSNGRVRFVHVIPGASAIDIYVDSELTVSALEFGQSSLYVTLPAGDHNVTVTQAGVTTALWEQPLPVATGSAQTLVAATTEPLIFQAFQDDLAALPLGKARFTAIHAIADGPAVDVVLSDGRPVVSGLQYNQIYGTLDLPALTYELAVVPTGESLDNAIVEVQPYGLSSGTSYDLLIYGTAARPQALLLGASGSGADNMGFIRLAHGIPDGPAVDVYMNTVLVAPSLDFDGGSTEYIAAAPGPYEVTVREAGTQTDLALANVDLASGQYISAVVLGGDNGVSVQPFVDEVGAVSATDAVINLINALPGDATALLELADGSTLTGDVASGDSSAAVVPSTEGGATVTITSDGDTTDAALDLNAIPGGVYYDAVVVAGDEGPQALLLGPVGLAVSVGSAPGSQTIAAAAPAATEEVAQQPTSAPTTAPDQPTAAAPQPTAAAPTEAAPQPTQAPAATAAAGPTARVLLNPGANLQLRQYPDASAFSLGLAPSGTVLGVLGREGEPQAGPFETPAADATEFVDPVTLLGEREDLNPADTWLFVRLTAPDGGTIDAWVNALYVALAAPNGQPMPLRNLPTIPANRAGQSNTSAILPPVETVAEVTVTVGGLDEGVNLQIRRTPSTNGESLTLVPTGTVLDFLGINEARDWVFVRYNQPSGNVTGWASARYIVGYIYQNRAIDFEEMEQRGLLTITPDEERGRLGGEVTAPGVAPTRDPLRNAVVAQVFVNDGVSLQLRLHPDINAFSQALIPNGSSLVIDGRNETSEWLHTTFDGKQGWVSVRYVELSFNGLPYEISELPVYVERAANLSDEQFFATATAASAGTATVEPTAQRYPAEIVVDVVAMTADPGVNGNGLPTLTRGRQVYFIFTTNDGEFSLIQLEDGTVGWVPSYAVFIK